jgi:hypothetical protein
VPDRVNKNKDAHAESESNRQDLERRHIWELSSEVLMVFRSMCCEMAMPYAVIAMVERHPQRFLPDSNKPERSVIMAASRLANKHTIALLVCAE